MPDEQPPPQPPKKNSPPCGGNGNKKKMPTKWVSTPKQRKRPSGRKPKQVVIPDTGLARIALDRWARKALVSADTHAMSDVRRTLAASVLLAANTNDPDQAKVYGLIAVSALKALSEIRCAEIKADSFRVGRAELPRFASPAEYDAQATHEQDADNDADILTAEEMLLDPNGPDL